MGEFSQAAAFAANEAADVRVDWLNAVYCRWADDQPRAAMEQVAQLSEPSLRQTAFDSAISRWAKNDSKAAAQYALTFLAGRERTFALSAALRAWAANDPTEAATWMKRFEPSSELDFGAATVASQPDAIRQPQVAISWAESIVDPRLRVRTLATVVSEWAATDPIAARNYAEISPNLQSDERSGVLAAFEPNFTPLSILP